MKNLFKTIFVFAIIIMATSCSKDNINEDFVEEESNATIESNQSRNANYILTALVGEDFCTSTPSGYGTIYTIYASSGRTKVNYDRIINVGVVKNNEIIDGKIVTIPANTTKSENKVVFTNATESYGAVSVRVFSITDGTNDITNQFELRNTTANVNNCYNMSSGGGDVDFCNGNDADGDGICDDNDPDFDDGTGFN